MARSKVEQSDARTLELRDFPGIILQSDAHDIPPGAGQDQVNARSDMQGQLTPRDGMLPVTFDSSSP